MSQEELGERVGSTQRQVSRYERGANDPTGAVLVRFATALETSTDWLLGLTDAVAKPVYSESDLDAFELELLRILREKGTVDKAKILEIAKVL